MTREDRLIVSLDEIRALRWTCTTCHLAMAFALDQPIRLPVTCPGCGADAVDPTLPAHQVYADFVRTVKVLRHRHDTTLQLELLAESAPPPIS